MTTDRHRLVPGDAGAGGYRPLMAADGEQHLVRDDLTGTSLPAGWRRSARALLVIAQLSDTHVMDHQSPGRAELLDRYSDFDSPIRDAVGVVGSYRAQELFTFQVAEAMVRAVRRTQAGPAVRRPGRFRHPDRRRDRQLPAQRAAGLHQPARRRPGPAGLR